MNLYFNDINKFKYDLTFFTCKHCSINKIFDNSIEIRDHCLKYHDIDIRFANSKHRQQNKNYKRYVREHVYNYSSFFSHDYVTMKVSIFEYNFTFCLNTNEKVNFVFDNCYFKTRIYMTSYIVFDSL